MSTCSTRSRIDEGVSVYPAPVRLRTFLSEACVPANAANLNICSAGPDNVHIGFLTYQVGVNIIPVNVDHETNVDGRWWRRSCGTTLFPTGNQIG
jgi:hypothetical protein